MPRPASTLPSGADLSYFLELATTGSISRAAERLGIRQPSLSLALSRLEHQLGVTLATRRSHGVDLTSEGKRFAQQARALLLDWGSLRDEVRREGDRVAGRFSLGCHVSVALYSLMHFLPRLLADHPHLEFQLHHDLSRKMTEQVVSRAVDFAIVVNPARHPDLVISPLAEDWVTFWSVTGKPHSVLLYDSALSQSDHLLKLARSKLKFDRTVTSPSLEVIAQLAADGLGCAILPTRVATRGRKKLKPLSAGPSVKDRICLVYRGDSAKTAATRAIVTAIRGARI